MAPNDDIMHEIMRTLGRLEESVDGVREDLKAQREDFRDEKENAHESRGAIHRRLDEHSKQMSKTDETIAISGQVEAMLRDQIKSLKETVDKNHKEVEPAISEWRRIKILGAGFGTVLVLLGISLGAIVTWASDTATTAIRHWLKIG